MSVYCGSLSCRITQLCLTFKWHTMVRDSPLKSYGEQNSWICISFRSWIIKAAHRIILTPLYLTVGIKFSFFKWHTGCKSDVTGCTPSNKMLIFSLFNPQNIFSKSMGIILVVFFVVCLFFKILFWVFLANVSLGFTLQFPMETFIVLKSMNNGWWRMV